MPGFAITFPPDSTPPALHTEYGPNQLAAIYAALGYASLALDETNTAELLLIRTALQVMGVDMAKPLCLPKVEHVDADE